MNICHSKSSACLALLIASSVCTSTICSQNLQHESTSRFTRLRTVLNTISTCAKNGINRIVHTKNQICTSIGRITTTPRTKNIVKKFIIPSLAAIALIGCCKLGYNIARSLYHPAPIHHPAIIHQHNPANNPVHHPQAILNENPTCRICLGEFNHDRVRLFPCGHDVFCRSCIGEWQSQQNICPICRTAIEGIGDYQ